uniref:Cysteine-rich DPF motif domain-containing protein 1 n=1 Tax=Sus scrofa TaxID=9823 RepID=A0A8D1JY93_PIG
MACEAGRSPLGMFECQLCALTAPYSYVGQRPPYTQSIVLLEESYVMKDPFTSDKDRFLILGSRCSLCGRLVCVGPVGEPRAPGRLPSLPVAATSRAGPGRDPSPGPARAAAFPALGDPGALTVAWGAGVRGLFRQLVCLVKGGSPRPPEG